MNAEIERAQTSVDAVIEETMRRFPGYSERASARFFEEVHQLLSPLARKLERQNKAMTEALKLFVAAERGHGWSDCAPDTQERQAIDAARRVLAECGK